MRHQCDCDLPLLCACMLTLSIPSSRDVIEAFVWYATVSDTGRHAQDSQKVRSAQLMLQLPQCVQRECILSTRTLLYVITLSGEDSER